MNILQTVIMGIVEGITEFLPISSTGHLILTRHFLGIADTELQSTFEIVIQLGAILAVVVLFKERFAGLFKADKRHLFSGRREWILLALTTLPAAILGFLLHNFIKTHLFGPETVLWALLVGGLAIIIVEKSIKPIAKTDSLDHLTPLQAIIIGLFQCFALWPGMSRAASTIIGGLFAGLNRKVAAEYSFLAAVPIMFMVSFYELWKARHLLHAAELTTFGIGFVVAFIAALFAVKTFIQILQRFSLTPFAIYRIIIALVFLLTLK